MRYHDDQTRLWSRAAAVLSVLLILAACSQQPVYPPAPQQGSDVAIDTASLQLGVPQFFTYHYHGRNVNFFVLKTAGKISSFLDACMSCYPRKLGYRYEDGSVVCRACDVRYPVTKLETGLGGCYPVRVMGRTENGKYRIPLSALERQAGKF